jgi:hypothetical protein
MKSVSIVYILFAAVLAISCGSKPKVIEAEEASGHVHSDGAEATSQDIHRVVCEDFLHTDKYTYLDVSENGQRFWIASPKTDVEKGATYYYVGGLKKTNFKSTEYDRVFETIYLVSGITKLEASPDGSAVDRALAQHQDPSTAPKESVPSAGLVKISELLTNSSKYEGQIVTVKGRCVKINKMIMGRNWVHIDDGSVSGKDLTITTMADVPVGTNATMTGTIVLNRDFGAGYKYDVIMEDARVE